MHMASPSGVPGSPEMLHLEQLEAETVQQMTPDVARDVITERIALNLRETGHPFHHKTASGTIVNADPTLDKLVARLTDAAPAVPVVHDWYNTQAGIAFLKATYPVE